MRIILIDNYDSFTYNIVHYLEQLGVKLELVMNDVGEMPIWADFDAVVISPGPGLPENSGFLLDWLGVIPNDKPVLGVCLGLQSLVVHTGGEIVNLPAPLHGQKGVIHEIQLGCIWSDISTPVAIGHYHSWVANPEKLPDCWDILAKDEQGHIMAIAHKERPWFAVQFHPESILSDQGILWFDLWLSQGVSRKSLT
jgi:anthranilate synthase component 2